MLPDWSSTIVHTKFSDENGGMNARCHSTKRFPAVVLVKTAFPFLISLERKIWRLYDEGLPRTVYKLGREAIY